MPPDAPDKPQATCSGYPGLVQNFASPPPTPSNAVVSQSVSQVATLLDRAISLHASDISTFSSLSNVAGSSVSDQAFLRNVLAGGTLSDRLSALTLMVQGAPLHNIRALETLKNLAEKRRGGINTIQEGEKGKGKPAGREDRLKAARAIMDWWVGGGAPDRKLRYFRDRPLLHQDVTDQHLIVWYFEDWLKKYFFSYLQMLEVFSLDPLPYVRMQSLTLIATLLRSKPEQEQNLLRLLVNKLGDTESTICARTSYHLLHVLQEHPAMKTVIIREMMALIMRPSPLPSLSTAPHLQPNIHVRFSSGQTSTPKREKNVSHAHVQYYAVITFNQIVLSTSEADRAVARKLIDIYFQLFCEVVGERKPELTNTSVHIAEDIEIKRKQKNHGEPRTHGGKSKQVRGAAGFAEVQDANAKLLGAILTGINRALPYARFGGGEYTHMSTLFLLVHTSTFNITLRALTLIQQVAASLPPSSPIVSRFYRALYATLLDSRMHTTRNQALFLNLLFKSLKADSNQSRIMAFVKRFCQVLVNGFGGSEFVAGGLWLLGELFSASPGLHILTNKAPLPGVEGTEYEPYKREPQYAHAQSSVLWELTALVHHAHPTIALLARQLLSREPLTSSPDLTLYTLTHFLDRFVYKNPKKASARGTSAMQPSTTGYADGVRRVRVDIQETPLNVEGWWRRGEPGVAVDQIFFQRYFAQKHEKEQKKTTKVDRRKGKCLSSETESEQDGSSNGDSDPEEALIWKAMKASMPSAADDDSDGNIEHSISDSELDEHASSDIDGDQEGLTAPHDSYPDEGWKFGLSSTEASETDDLEHLDAEAPVELIHEEAAAAQQESSTVGGGKRIKRKRHGKEDLRIRKKKLRALPTFASYDDFAQMIEGQPEENI